MEKSETGMVYFEEINSAKLNDKVLSTDGVKFLRIEDRIAYNCT